MTQLNCTQSILTPFRRMSIVRQLNDSQNQSYAGIQLARAKFMPYVSNAHGTLIATLAQAKNPVCRPLSRRQLYATTSSQTCTTKFLRP
jgi:hypothetical protein